MRKVYSGPFPWPSARIPRAGANSCGPNDGLRAQTTTGTKGGATGPAAGRARRLGMRAAALAAAARSARGPRFSSTLGGARQFGIGQQGDEALGFEQVPSRAALGEPELGEDRGRLGVAALLAPLGLQPLALGEVALVGVEDEPHVQLRRDRAVPLIGFELEREVVAADAAQAVELPAEPEGDRAAGVAAVGADAELQVFAFPDRGQVAQLAAGQQQSHVRVAEAERREARELLAELERQVRPVHERVDQRRRDEVVLGERAVADRREGLGERRQVLGLDREPGRSSVTAPALELAGALPQ